MAEYVVIGAEETPQELSARLRRPVCMLLRANRLVSDAWLMPGRTIFAPPPDFCKKDAGACPLHLQKIPAENWLESTDIDRSRLPARLRRWSDTHGGVSLPEWHGRLRCGSIRPGETAACFAARMGTTETVLRRVNRWYGAPVPGIELLIPED